MRSNFFLLWIMIILTSVTSCKGTKTATSASLKKLKSQKIIANHYNSSFNFETLNAKLKVRYDNGSQSFSPNVTLRMKKDEVIWISAKLLGITWAKALITPDKVSYYEKVNNTYFEGDFELLSNWLGTPLDFQKIQQLLLGQSIYNLRKEKFEASIEVSSYKLVPKEEFELFQRIFLLNPETFKMNAQILEQPIENRKVEVNYTSYQKVGNQNFPKDVDIKATDGSSQTRIQVDYRNVDYNARVSFPFEIPSGYQEMKVE